MNPDLLSPTSVYVPLRAITNPDEYIFFWAGGIEEYAEDVNGVQKVPGYLHEQENGDIRFTNKKDTIYRLNKYPLIAPEYYNQIEVVRKGGKRKSRRTKKQRKHRRRTARR